MIIIDALKKIIDSVKYNGVVGGMAEKDQINHKKKHIREEREIKDVRDVEGLGMIFNNERDDFTTLGDVLSSTKYKSISSDLTEIIGILKTLTKTL